MSEQYDMDQILSPFEVTKAEIDQAQEQMRTYSPFEVLAALSLGKGPEFLDRYHAGELTEEEWAEIDRRQKNHHG